jgi:hypothetical protein
LTSPISTGETEAARSYRLILLIDIRWSEQDNIAGTRGEIDVGCDASLKICLRRINETSG